MAKIEGRRTGAERRAFAFVGRADAALADLPNADRIWDGSIGSRADEARLHTMSFDLDNAIRRVDGGFETWRSIEPHSVETVVEIAPIAVFWLVSSHPSGHVRQEAVRHMAAFHSDRILPHIANRAIDFVPAVRELAAPLLIERLAVVAADRTGPGPHGVLPTAAHIAIGKLLAPRTARLSPDVVQPCVELASTASMSRPRQLRRGANEDDALAPFHQALATATEPSHRDALELLIAYLSDNQASHDVEQGA